MEDFSLPIPIPLTPKNYHIWIKQLQAIATKAEVWKYVDPAGTKEEPPQEKFPEVSDYRIVVAAPASRTEVLPAVSPLTSWITRPARNYDELSEAQQKSYELEFITYRMKQRLLVKIGLGICTVDTAVKASARAYIPHNKMASPVRDIIKHLAARYRLSDEEIVEQIYRRFQILKKPPVKAMIETWVADWENLKEQIEEMKILRNFSSETIFVHDFLRAGRIWAPSFCDNWIGMRLAANKPVEFGQTTRQYRLEIERASKKS